MFIFRQRFERLRVEDRYAQRVIVLEAGRVTGDGRLQPAPAG